MDGVPLAGGRSSPWDATFLEFAIASLSQYNTRHYLIPPALGVDFRSSTATCTSRPVGGRRPGRDRGPGPRSSWSGPASTSPNWAPLYDALDGQDPRPHRRDGGARASSRCPTREDLAVVTEGRGMGSRLRAASAEYHRLVDLALQLWQYHFEFLNLGYAAYLDFFGFCKQAFPSHPRPGHRQDGRRRRRRPVPARRGAEEAGPARRRPRRRRPRSTSRRRRR